MYLQQCFLMTEEVFGFIKGSTVLVAHERQSKKLVLIEILDIYDNTPEATEN